MFRRNIISKLVEWKAKPDRKPLILRGARQVGKTTLVEIFSAKYDQYIYLNLDYEPIRALFEKFENIHDLVQAIFIQARCTLSGKTTLIFLDEIQESPQAIKLLRYFYEEYPALHIIAAGSLLESLFDYQISFPVGRVEFLVVRPVSFDEFLTAIDDSDIMRLLDQFPLPAYAYPELFRLFHQYTLIGGMPEVVRQYAVEKDLSSLAVIYDSLLQSYLDDVEKYANNHTAIPVIRHAIRAIFTQAGNRIKMQSFGNSNYGSREMGEALRALEKAMLIHLMYPLTDVRMPMIPDLKKYPRIQVFDTGLMNYIGGLQVEILGTHNLNEIYAGKVAEHIVGQEIRSTLTSPLSSLAFWIRDKKTSSAEVDFVFPFEGQLIPIEVKSGAAGKMRSLHQFMDMSPHDIAFRLYAGEFRIDNTRTTQGKTFRLVSMPYFLASRIDLYLRKIL